MSSITFAHVITAQPDSKEQPPREGSSSVPPSRIILRSSAEEDDRCGSISVTIDSFLSSNALRRVIELWETDYMLLEFPGERLLWNERSLERLIETAKGSNSGLVYSDFAGIVDGHRSERPLLDLQLGSIRDSFDFGGAILLSRKHVHAAIEQGRDLAPGLRWGALYDLRLRLSEIAAIVHIPEVLYTRSTRDARESGERIFDYVDPSKREYQIEMESIATSHLKRIGAFLNPDFKSVAAVGRESFPVLASVVIPVRNRVGTVKDALESALSQRTDFAFNVIVVDNHSDDGTTDVITGLARSDDRVIHLIPPHKNLGIGGCWNTALYSAHCGCYAIQLDSDDLYSSHETLARAVEMLDERNYAMVIGAYRTVDFELKDLPPGLVDHREWTRENGRNNALRINGLGAPRAFNVSVLREIGFPNVSYGEDYAVALRLSREYEIGRIYDPLYLARRWKGNSDSSLSHLAMNTYDRYKDWLRTQEIVARQALNRSVISQI